MKKLTTIIAVLVAAVAMTVPASAGFRIGPRAGIAVSSLHFNEDLFAKENRAGFTGGVEAEITLPLGICIDGSVMYVRRSIDAVATEAGEENISVDRDYINVPLNLKWKIGLPLVGKIVTPYLFTGPDFAFLTSKQAINDAWRSHKVDVAWNFGFGLELFSHLQVGASYGLGMTKLAHTVGMSGSTHSTISGKNNYWTVTAAWLF